MDVSRMIGGTATGVVTATAANASFTMLSGLIGAALGAVAARHAKDAACE
jgi:hypothetical protein